MSLPRTLADHGRRRLGKHRAAFRYGQEVEGPEGVSPRELPAKQPSSLLAVLLAEEAGEDRMGIRAVELLPSSERSTAGRIYTSSFRPALRLGLPNA